MKHLLWLAACMLYLASSQAQNIEVERIDPPNWWNEMDHNTVELLVYGKNIGKSTASIESKTVVIVKQEPGENDNYLWVTVRLRPETLPGKINILFTAGEKRAKYDWEIKAREHGGTPRGVRQNDLIYLVFPDRFANGNPKNDRIDGMKDASLNREEMFDRHGGDIQGIIDHLDYLQELGVTALWINPLLESDQPEESYHGYAITDHYKIDPRFGTNEDYVRLVAEAHARKIKVIQDVVFNHVGNEHWFIKDMPSEDWVHQHDKFTKTNYRATTLLDPYTSEYDKNLMTDGWFDTHMPDLNQRNKHLERYFIQNSIWWVETTGQDGFRIDTYAYSDRQFMANWAEAIKKAEPLVSMFGETWVHGTPVQSFFVGRNAIDGEFESHLPGVTDFQLYYALNHALNNNFGWTEGVARLYYTLAKDVLYGQPSANVVFLDNHDVSRFYSVVGEDFDKWKMGIGFLMTTRGTPMLYYGTELLMANYADPDGKVREDFPGGWAGDSKDKFTEEGRTSKENEAYNYIKKLANWRKESNVMRSGKFMHFVPEEGVYVYFRYIDREAVMVIMNQNSESKTIDGKRFQERTKNFSAATNVVTGESKKGLDKFTVPGMTTMILELGR